MADLSNQPTPIQSIYALYREEKLFVNRRYQRKLVWTLVEKQKFVESIQRKYPVPAILLAEKEDKPGSFEIIDGLQRLHAIVSFIENAFGTEENLYFNLKLFSTALGHAEQGHFEQKVDVSYLTQEQTSTILDYPLPLSVMRNATEQEINDVFSRINTYGHRLSDQERRQAGIHNEFSSMVRRIACQHRGDVSDEIIPLTKMPLISIDLPKSKYGYKVQAENVFWVRQGVLKSTDLRDSMDEQYISDIAACVVGGKLIERSKESLDLIYDQDEAESSRIIDALKVYGVEKFTDEFNFCTQEILKVCKDGKEEKLRGILFENHTTNAFPSVFAVLFMAFYELLIKDKKVISSYSGVKDALRSLNKRIATDRGATAIAERRKNINTIRGLISQNFVPRTAESAEIYGSHTTIDIESIIRRSEIELAGYELKQGILMLKADRAIDQNMIEKVAKTICAIANNGPNSSGRVLIGVADKPADVSRIRELDGVDGIEVGERVVVGIAREAKLLGKTVDQYYSIWKNGIQKSDLSEPLKSSVASLMQFNSFYGLGVIVINIPSQKSVSYYGDDVYWRNQDNTEIATTGKKSAEIASRF